MNIRLLLCLLSLVLLNACDTLRTSSDFDPKYNFSSIKTYALLGDQQQKEEFQIKDPLVSKHIAYSIEKQLQKKGLKLLDSKPVDFYVRWYGTVKNKSFKEQIRTYENTYYNNSYADKDWKNSDQKHRRRYPSDYGRSTTEVRDRTYNYEYQEGTLFIDILDGKTRELIWRGIGEDYLGKDYEQKNMSQRITEAVTRILFNFPPKITASIDKSEQQ